MEPKKVGRTLGIGVRVASKMVRERVERATSAHSDPVGVENGRPAAPAAASPGIKIDSTMAGAKRGAKAFGQAFLGPFTHAGGVLWLEITGMFFALFALFFIQNIYRTRGSWNQGPEHAHLLLYIVLAIGFAWFSFSSFMRAYRKSRRGPGTRS
jgi:hypothetical protein